MKILITGSNGFVGKNLVSTLAYLDEFEILTFNRNDAMSVLDSHTKECDFVVHLAGVNRSQNPADFYNGNVVLIERLVTFLKNNNNKAPILLTSSIQVDIDSHYGKSKKAAEEILVKYGEKENIKIMIYRLPNLFGKWSQPDYNSVIATWCYQIARNKKTEISNPYQKLKLVYIDDLVSEIILSINNKGNIIFDNYYNVKTSYELSLSEIYEALLSFKNIRQTKFIPDLSNHFTNNLYNTYLSYLPIDDFSYDLITHFDKRGSFTEFVKSDYSGQVSINIFKPNQTKGDHWHKSKNEKFVVVKGVGLIKFRNIFKDEIVEYKVNDKKLEVIEVPAGYTHNITNIGKEDMIVLMWVNKHYKSDDPDIFFELVDKELKIWKN